MTERRILSFELYKTERYGDDKDAPPTEARAFIAWLERLIESVPVEHRESVSIQFDDDGDYDYPRPELTVFWTRPETDEEVLERETEQRTYNERREAEARNNELSLLAALKAKYEQH